jgi:deoxyribose-phosphate aldolase
VVDVDIQRIVDEVTRGVLAALEEEERAGGASPGPCPGATGECAACGRCAEVRPEEADTLRLAGAARLSSASGIGKVRSDLAGIIDHTLLKAEATRDELTKLCEEAVRWGFYSVCVNSANVRFCANLLRGSTVVPIAVVGFPLGAMGPKAKAFEARQAVRDGAREIDMVLNIGKLKHRDYDYVFEDIVSVVAGSRPCPVKVIIESSALTDEEKVAASALAAAAGARFVKTSTGFGKGGATVDDVELIRRVVGDRMEIKASGGVHDAAEADALVKAGATRIGASASVVIVTGGASKSNY